MVYPTPIVIQQIVGNPPFLGMLVEDINNEVIILQIQTDSPAQQAGLVIGDSIVSISGSQVDSKYTFARLIGQHVAGDQVEVGIMQNGFLKTVIVTLAQLLPAVILTPSAEITISDNTRLVIDIGFNGVTGVTVLEDQAHIREPVTGSEMDIPAGMALIVVPGEPVGTPFSIADSDINKWWENPSPPTSDVPGEATSPDPTDPNHSINRYKDFNPLPSVNEESLYIFGCIIAFLLYFSFLFIILIKK